MWVLACYGASCGIRSSLLQLLSRLCTELTVQAVTQHREGPEVRVKDKGRRSSWLVVSRREPCILPNRRRTQQQDRAWLCSPSGRVLPCSLAGLQGDVDEDRAREGWAEYT